MNRGRKGLLAGICLALGSCSSSVAPPTEADVAVATQKREAVIQKPLRTIPERAAETLAGAITLETMEWEKECSARDEDCYKKYARLALREKHCKELMLRHGFDLSGISVFKEDGDQNPKVDLLSACVRDEQNLPGTSNFGIALSGGGARSASFSMGVLKALHELGHLERAETISSVSGGGYTSFWYYMQQYHTLLQEHEVGSSADDAPEPWHDYEGILAGLETLQRKERAARSSAGSYRGAGISGALSGGFSDDVPDDVPGDFADVATWLKNQGVSLDSDAQRAAAFCERAERYQDDVERPSLVSRMFEARTDNHVVDNDYRYQRHLSEQSDIINYSPYALVQAMESSGLVLAHGVVLPFYWVTDGLLNLNWLDGFPLTDAYRKGLERTYGLTLNDQYQDYIDYLDRQPRQFINGKDGVFLWWRENARISPVSFTRMRQFLQAYNLCAARSPSLRPLPMPIINTKETLPENLQQKLFEEEEVRLGLGQGVFSFSPLSWGSVAVRFQDEGMRPAPVSVSKAVAISGAAADNGARELEGVMEAAMSVLNANLGHDIRRPDRSSAGPWLRGADAVLGGVPLKWIMPESITTTIRLSDGGHAENLGLYPLVERRTRYMVVVDAEHDDGYVFDALNRVLAKLRVEEPAARVSCTNCPNGGKLLEGLRPSVFDLRLTSDTDESPLDIAYVKLSLPLPEAGERQAECTPSLAEIRALADDRIKALRMGTEADELAAVPVPCSVWHYYQSERDKESNSFPHNSTADIWYDPLQYEAYRDLGYYLGMTELAAMLAPWKEEIVRLQNEEEEAVRRYRAEAEWD